MSYELKVIDNPTEFSEAVGEIASGKRNELILGQWAAGGLLEFASIVFPGVEPQDIFAKHHDREPEGHEPHFDVYKSFVDEERPWLGHFNISGDCDVVTTELAADLAEAYELRYPEQSPEAAAARRHFARIALEEPEARVGHGLMTAGTRMVLPVRPQGPHIIHDMVPKDSTLPGEFIKLIVATRADEERSGLQTEAGYTPLDTFLTRAAGFEVQEPSKKESKPKKSDDFEPEDTIIDHRSLEASGIKSPRKSSKKSTRSIFTPSRERTRRRCTGLD